jgi:hypothetical protein
MHQCGGVQQFDQGSCPVCTFVHFTAKACGEEDKHRSHLFAFSFEDVLCDGIQQRNGASHRTPESGFKSFDMMLNGGFYFVVW